MTKDQDLEKNMEEKLKDSPQFEWVVQIPAARTNLKRSQLCNGGSINASVRTVIESWGIPDI